MGRWYHTGLAAMVCAALAGCAADTTPPRPALSPTDTLVLLRAGQPLVNCRDACLENWRRAQPQAAQLDSAGRWPDLAVYLTAVGYQDDLSLYYLARAAEGMGYAAAAASYYRQSAQISGTSLSCRHQSRICGGVDLPRAALWRLAALERDAQPRSRRGGAAPRVAVPDRQPEPGMAPPAGEAAYSPGPVVLTPVPAAPAAPAPPPEPPAMPTALVPPAAAAPPQPAPTPPPRRPGGPMIEFIEPPPAR